MTGINEFYILHHISVGEIAANDDTKNVLSIHHLFVRNKSFTDKKGKKLNGMYENTIWFIKF
jgi:hypothetical protein